MQYYVKFNGNWCWTWVELHEVIHHRLQSSPSRPNWSPTRRSRVGLQLGRDGLDWSCTRWTSVDSTQGHWVQVQVQRGAAELNLDLDEVALSWSCTRSSTSTLRPSPSRPSWSSTRRSRVELQLGRDGLGLNVLVLLRVQLQCNVDKLGGKYTEAEPRCTCPPHESTLQRSLWWITECNSNAKFTRREASTPRRSRGVLVLPTSQLCIQVGEVHVQLLMDLMLVHWRFCYCKRVRIDWAEWLSEPIWNTNAMRVSEYIILPKDAW